MPTMTRPSSLSNGANIIIHQMVNSVDTPIYPLTWAKNVFVNGSGTQSDLETYLSNLSSRYVPLAYDGTNYDGAASNPLRFLGDTNEWRVIQDASTSQKGVVQLATTLSTSETVAATIKAVKDLSDTAADTYTALSQLGQSGESIATADRKALYIPYLDNQGKILSKFLPSYVDDVIEGYLNETDGKFYATKTAGDPSPTYSDEITAEGGKIYVNLENMKTYRWGGSAYAVISDTLAIGTTAGTAYDGASGAALALRVDSLEAGNVVIKGKAATNNSYADNTIDDGKIEVTVGSGDNPTSYTITVFDTTRVSAFLDKDALDIVTSGLNGTGITSAQSTAQKAAILNLIGYRDSTTGEFQMADSTHAGLMSAAQNNKLANAQEIIVTGNGVTTMPTFASGSGIWYQTVGVDA